MVNILGIHDGHAATAAVIRDGKVLAAISEERITRIKNSSGCPKNAIKEVLEISKINPEDIDIVAIANLSNSVTPDEFVNESKLIRKSFSKFYLLPQSVISSPRLIRPYKFLSKKTRNCKEIVQFLEKMNIKAEIKQVEHHFAHAATAAYTSWYSDKDSIVITLDGSGDGVCSTINLVEDNEIKRIHEMPAYNSIGEFYARVTQFLGMKPLEHEYKVMGLAPYAPKDYVEKTYDNRFKNLFDVNGLELRNRTGRWGDSYLPFFKKRFDNIRFDVLAAGAQRLVEENVIKWIKNIINETGIRNVGLAGGVFMNVKLNMLLNEMPEIEDLFIFPSCGDESIAIGAALKAYHDFCAENGIKAKFEPLKDLYWGGEFGNEDIERYLNSDIKNKIKFNYIDDIENEVAHLLTENKILARVNGRMEWGARALGNRSILANPANNQVINKINKAIKKRDFWMPFTPSILFERKDDYLIDPRDTKAPYMILAYETTELAQKELIGALHPYDLTGRPQLVEKGWNSKYYDIINSFQDMTGIGGILNTSLNLHGDPVVYTPKDAVYTLLNSSLDYLAIGNYLVEKK